MNLKRLAFLSILLTYGLIVFGGYVASSESGMGCGPEWPLCNGDVIPTLKGETLIEFAHRVIGAILAVMTVYLFFKIISTRKEKRVRMVAWWMILLLAVQILLGAVVVVLDLPAIIVTVHLLIAMVFLAALLWIWRNVSVEESSLRPFYSNTLSENKQKSARKHLNFLLLLLILTLAFGAYIKHRSYGLACGWLSCGDSLSPNSIPELLQTVHRLLAFVSTIYILLITYLAFAKKWGAAIQRRLLIGILTVLLQLVIGVLTIISYLEVPWAVLHLALGTALFAFVFETRVCLGPQIEVTKLTVMASERRKEHL